jgi:hypothetical protein
MRSRFNLLNHQFIATGLAPVWRTIAHAAVNAGNDRLNVEVSFLVKIPPLGS